MAFFVVLVSVIIVPLYLLRNEDRSWKTYNDSVFGFSLDYPPGWTVTQPSDSSQNIIANIFPLVPEGATTGPQGISIKFDERTIEVTRDMMKNALVPVYNEQAIQLSGETAYRFTGYVPGVTNGVPDPSTKVSDLDREIVAISDGENSVEIEYGTASDMTIIDRILGSFHLNKN